MQSRARGGRREEGNVGGDLGEKITKYLLPSPSIVPASDC